MFSNIPKRTRLVNGRYDAIQYLRGKKFKHPPNYCTQLKTVESVMAVRGSVECVRDTWRQQRLGRLVFVARVRGVLISSQSVGPEEGRGSWTGWTDDIAVRFVPQSSLSLSATLNVYFSIVCRFVVPAQPNPCVLFFLPLKR